jgi:hypothetical protein
MKWFKFYGQDWLTDMKVIRLSTNDRLRFITLLCLASSTDDGVIRDCDDETLDHLTHLKGKTEGSLKRFQSLGMISVDGAGTVTIKNFVERQSSNLTGYERLKRYREKVRDGAVINDNASDNANDNPRTEKNRTEKNREEKNTGKEKVAPLPDWLKIEVWEMWVKYRKEIKKTLTPLSVMQQLKFLSLHKKDHVAIIEKSIQQGWTGLFALSGQGKSPSNVLPAKDNKYDKFNTAK